MPIDGVVAALGHFFLYVRDTKLFKVKLEGRAMGMHGGYTDRKKEKMFLI